MADVSDAELKKVIGDFLEQGHVENIVSMFKRNPDYYTWTGELLDDQRFNVRLGISILFEELKKIQPELLPLAIPSLSLLLASDSANIRGEAISVLGIIGNPAALVLVRSMAADPSPQIREIVELVLGGET
jgi:HEAT repeat protein